MFYKLSDSPLRFYYSHLLTVRIPTVDSRLGNPLKLSSRKHLIQINSPYTDSTRLNSSYSDYNISIRAFWDSGLFQITTSQFALSEIPDHFRDYHSGILGYLRLAVYIRDYSGIGHQQSSSHTKMPNIVKEKQPTGWGHFRTQHVLWIKRMLKTRKASRGTGLATLRTSE